MRFRLVWHDTTYDNKHELPDRACEYLGDRQSIFKLWVLLKKSKAKHVQVFALDGRKFDLEKGINVMVDYNP